MAAGADNRRRAALLGALIFAAAPLFGQSQEEIGRLTGQPIVAVRVVNDERRREAALPPEFPLRAGEPYRPEAVREALRQLYRSGMYDDIEVQAWPEPGGLRVEFHVRENFYLDLVRVRGLKNPAHEALAEAALRLRLGEPARASELREAEARLQETLRSLGLFEASVRVAKEARPETRQLSLLFQVEPGPIARIASVEGRSLDGRPLEDLVVRSKLRPGDPARAELLEHAAERVRKHLAKKGYLGARVVARRGPYDAATKRLPVTLEIYRGPLLAVEVHGAKIPERTLRRLLPIYQEGAIDEDLLQEGRRNIRDYLESQGYFDSQVQYVTRQEENGGRQVITYQVERGARRRFVGFAFTGNSYFSDELLRDQVRLRPAGTLSRGRFSRKLLAEDSELLRNLYVANGFREAKVEAELVENYQGRSEDLFVRFAITEGPQTLIEELNIEGNQTLSDEYLLREAINFSAGQPFSEFNVLSDRDNVLAVYFNEGFPDAKFSWEVAESNRPNRVRLTFRIQEGRQIRVKEILYSGMESTREETIRRQMEIAAGEPLRQGELIASQRKLYSLGIFSRVQIAPQNPSGQEAEKTLIVNVQEARRYTIAYGGGFEIQRQSGGVTDPVGRDYRVSPRGLFEFSRSNVRGLGHTWSLRARASSLQYRLLTSYLAPQLLGRPWLNLEFGGFLEKESNVKTYTARKYELSAQLVQQVNRATTMGYRYSYRRVLVDPDSLRVPPQEIPLLSQPTKVSSFGAVWIRDRRDNPAEASRGDFLSVDASVASRAIGATADFVRLATQHSTFHPLGPVSFARSTRFSVLLRYGGSQTFDIPLPERYFAGGGNSLRSFGFNQAGPRADTGFPVGGEALLIFNNELRFPLRLPFVRGRLGGAVFYDAGNVFSEIDRITLRASPRPQPLGMGDFFSHAVGMSFRYSTPIGPVRLDFGYLLNDVRFQFVETNSTTTRSARLPRFQFFFNIGSMF
jgi:outer membrane protein assembly complex protein YaeT